MIKILNGDMAEVAIDYDKSTVIKRGLDNIYTRLFNGFQREVEWLIRLRRFDRVPKILEVAYPDKLVMSYVGELISKETIPTDWYEQMEYILGELKKYGCCHNDIKPREILVNKGNLYLIDYNWATEIGEKLPDHPVVKMGLGCQYKKGDGVFDDRYSFIASILTILRGSFPEELKKVKGPLGRELVKRLSGSVISEETSLLSLPPKESIMTKIREIYKSEPSIKNKKNPVISIIGTTYNQDKLLERGLWGWLHQNFEEPYEIIVVDDGCKDETSELMMLLMEKYKNLRYVKTKRKRDPDEILVCSTPNNLGVKLANSSIVVVTWFDRIPTNNALSELYLLCNKEDKALVTLLSRHIEVSSSMQVISDDKLDSLLATVDWRKNLDSIFKIAGKLDYHSEPYTQLESACFSVRKKYWEWIGGYDERYKMLPSQCNLELYERFKKFGCRIIVGNGAVFHQPHLSPRTVEGHAKSWEERSQIDDGSIIRNLNGWGNIKYEEVV